MSVTLITAIYNGIDEDKEIPEQTIPFERQLFKGQSDTPRKDALFYKTQIHTLGDYEYYIWIDGKVQITSSDFIAQCIEAIQGYDIAILKHHERNCIYQEVDHIEHCIRHGNPYLTPRYAHRPLRKQVEAYRTQGYPVKAGLNDCCIFIVRGQAMKEVFDKWWIECQMDWFDQISIRFLCWFYGKPIKSIVFKPGSFKDVPHAN
jgi:hypothetical protein